MRLNQIPDRIDPKLPRDQADALHNGGALAVALVAMALGGTPNRPPDPSGIPASRSADKLIWPGLPPQGPQKIQAPIVAYVPEERLDEEDIQGVTGVMRRPKRLKPLYAPFRGHLKRSIAQGSVRRVIKQPRRHNMHG